MVIKKMRRDFSHAGGDMNDLAISGDNTPVNSSSSSLASSNSASPKTPLAPTCLQFDLSMVKDALNAFKVVLNFLYSEKLDVGSGANLETVPFLRHNYAFILFVGEIALLV